ncbi:hypothetical protein BC938DRAFT_480092 [Jimgerdemannia flammicorona]|uniref:Uncharacterized protein n=1 Tax=Jimgerdemannia flammicorona TaxID=994334 RepID=A0A433QJE6_9FUNG|nr:hypothetical protein BC938DRAFT_480092 [Jimgerdemannia flammicorona]
MKSHNYVAYGCGIYIAILNNANSAAAAGHHERWSLIEETIDLVPFLLEICPLPALGKRRKPSPQPAPQPSLSVRSALDSDTT